MEQDTAVNEILGHESAASQWRNRALSAIDQFFWDEAAGLYFDYNLQTGQRRRYEFATTFYPLWAGLASKTEQVVGNLPKFEAPGGLHQHSHNWQSMGCPLRLGTLQLIAVQGLRRYGYYQEASRTSTSLFPSD